MTTYSPGDRVLVMLGGGASYEAEVIEDRGGRLVKVERRDDLERRTWPEPERVSRERIRPIPVKAPKRVEPMTFMVGVPVKRTSDSMSSLTASDAAAINEALLGHTLRAVPKPPKPWRSEAYLRHVRSFRCCMWQHMPSHHCSGDVVAHHHGPRGMGEKTDDSRTVPLCDGAHREFHDRGTIGDWTRAALDATFAAEMSQMLVGYAGSTHAETIIAALTAKLREV